MRFSKPARALLTAVAAGGALAAPLAASACSRVFSNANGKAMVVGRTMDLFLKDDPALVLRPRGLMGGGFIGISDPNPLRWRARHGSVGMLSMGRVISDGMNEKGLNANALYLEATKYEVRNPRRPGLSNARMVDYVLDNFATVNEALAGLAKVQVVSDPLLDRHWPIHLSLADPSGASAVVEWVNGAIKVHQGSDSLVMTNEPELDWQLENLKRYRPFGGTLALPGDVDPPSRFVRGSSYLKTLPKAVSVHDAEANVSGVMKNVAVPAGARDYSQGDDEDTWVTRWTTIANLDTGTYIFHLAANPYPVWVHLGQLRFHWAGGMRVLDVRPPALTGNVSAWLNNAPVKR
jgi:penicillin V acylase-like amidase (Ntn superfamily)